MCPLFPISLGISTTCSDDNEENKNNVGDEDGKDTDDEGCSSPLGLWGLDPISSWPREGPGNIPSFIHRAAYLFCDFITEYATYYSTSQSCLFYLGDTHEVSALC